jgi:hypothetical protein
VACFANLLGLNISAIFNSAVTIYILIPLIVIPQMILGGAMFSFDKLNRAIGGGEQVPIIAEVMTSRWAFEGLMVDQFMNNPYEKPLFEVEKKESMASFKQAYYIPKLQELMNDCVEEMDSKNASDLTERKENLKTIKNELLLEQSHIKTRVDFSGIENISSANFNDRMIENTQRIMDELAAYYAEIFNVINAKKMAMVQELTADEKSAKLLVEAKDDYTNDYLNELVTKSVEKNKIIVKDNYLIQKKDPVFLDASSDSFLNFRSHFFAPNKNFFGNLHSTFGFNVFIIWSFSVILYVVLYYDGLKRGIDFISKKIVFKSKK